MAMPDNLNDNLGAVIRAERERRGWSQTELADLVGTHQQTIGKIEGGTIKGHSRFLPKIREVLGLIPQEVDTGQPPVIVSASEQSGKTDLPLYGSAEGGGGAVVVTAEPVDWLRRPAHLATVRNAYGVIVSGDSMEPRFEQGEIVIVHPHLPPTANTDVVLYAEIDGERRAMIKRLLKATATEWILRQYNPKKDFKLPRKIWTECHRIVDAQFRR